MMKNNKWIFLVISFAMSFATVIAQDYSNYIKSARKYIQAGDYQKARSCYNVYKDMTGQIDEKLETIFANGEERLRQKQIQKEGYVDLGLPSKTCWASRAASSSPFTYNEAIMTFGSKLPSRQQVTELIKLCDWQWNNKYGYYKVIGPNGNYIIFEAQGARYSDGSKSKPGKRGVYWTSERDEVLYFFPDGTKHIQHNYEYSKRKFNKFYVICVKRFE